MADPTEQDKDSKTLEPTERALEKAREEGRTPLSRELPHLAFLLAVLLNIFVVLPWCMPSISRTLSAFLGPLHVDSLDGHTVQHMFTILIRGIGLPLASFLGVILVFIWGSGLAQSYRAISVKLITPKLSNLSLKKGWEKLFSLRALLDFVKTILKAVGLLAIVWIITRHIAWTHMLHWSIAHARYALAEWASVLIIVLLAVLICLASIDMVYQRWQYRHDLRMSHRDLRDEQKETEGNPEIKQKRRQLAMNRKRMMAAVPDATVVVTNPTHFAVALLWKEEEMQAPTVVAKGRDELALKIRSVATEHRVPIVENPPLARALFDQVDIDKEIPPEHYQAVANIIRWVGELGKRTV